jgi:hypothetical protein
MRLIGLAVMLTLGLVLAPLAAPAAPIPVADLLP